MQALTMKIGREHVLMDLLLLHNTDLQEVNRQLETALAFCGYVDERCVAVCLAKRKTESFEVDYWVVDPDYQSKGYGKTLLLYAFDYLKALGGQSADMTGSNADVKAFVSLQKLGFRIIGVLRNYYKNEDVLTESDIQRRDLLRYRFLL